jgi:YegS/Rv2252/BmrU family lipid kinase
MSRVFIVFNPNAGRGRSPLIAADISRLLEERGVASKRLTIAQYLGAPTTSDCDCVCALGGDGTVRAIVDAFAREHAERSPPVAVVALGTANLISKHLGLPWSAQRGLDLLVRAIIGRKTRSMDIPTANGSPFLIMCSSGFDARVVHELAAHRTGPITKLNYLPALARSWLGFSGDAVEVLADGKQLFGPEPALVVVANAPEYGTGFTLNPNATSNDGMLDLTIFSMQERKHLVSTAWAAVTKTVGKAAALMTTAKSIEIRGDSPAQIDGEAFGRTPIQIALLPFQQRFIVPE